MKYSLDIIIDKPVNEILELFDNEQNMFKWMDGLQNVELLSGTAGEVEAISKLTFLIGKRKMEMVETILSKNLPEKMVTTYDTAGVFNRIETSFKSTSDGKTKYCAEQEFRFDGLMMKAMGFLMPGIFKKQSLKYMTDFKKFAEAQN